MLSAYSAKWFAVYYFCLGTIGILGGIYMLIRWQQIMTYLKDQTDPAQAPPRIRIFLRYFMVFTLPTLVLSFFPFSIIELAFSVWCLLIIYVIGSLLLRWKSVRPFLKEQSHQTLRKFIRITGAIMLSLGGVMFVLFYRIIQTSF